LFLANKSSLTVRLAGQFMTVIVRMVGLSEKDLSAAVRVLVRPLNAG
jgi:hypothetical protein